MMMRIWEKLKTKKGQSLTEFALVIPVLCMIFMGTFDFGWILHKQITMDNATRAAARRAAVGATNEIVMDTIQNATYFTVPPETVTIEVRDQYHIAIADNTDRTPDNYIFVDIQLNDVELITPLKNFVAAITTINLNSHSEFLIE